MRSKALFFFVLPVFFFCFSVSAHAASLYMDPAFANLSRGDAVTVSVRLDTDEAEEECINAVDGVVRYSENIIPVDVSTGDSIFSVWVEPPTINTVDRTITFAGGIPNGYCGRIPGDPKLTNTLLTMVFRSPGFSVGVQGDGATSSAKIEFDSVTTAYLNDGFGTKAPLAMYGTSIDLSKSAGALLQDPWREAVVTDDIPPAEFSISIQKDTFAFGGKYFIVFNTLDKQTGIDQYQVIEEPLSKLFAFEWGGTDVPWIVTRSPYVLKDQSLNSVIRVKAIDKAGNEYIATLIPEKDMRTISVQSYIFYAGIGLIGLLLVTIISIGIRAFLKRRKNSNNKINKDIESSL